MRIAASLLAVTLLVAGLLAAAPGGRAQGADPPWAVSWQPATDAADVPVGTIIRIRWNATMAPASVESAFHYTDGATTYGSENGSWAHDGNTSTFSPSTLLRSATTYAVTVEDTATDLAGVRLDQNRNGVPGEGCGAGGDCLAWTFTTRSGPDTEPPTVVSTSPGSGRVGVAPDANLEVVFDDTMDVESVETAFRYTDGFQVFSVADGAATWRATAVVDDTLRFRPDLRFASGAQVTVTIDGSSAKDLAGNRLDGDRDGQPGGDYSWTFTVQTNLTPPHVLLTEPDRDEENVSVSATVRIVFDKAMDRTAVETAFAISGGSVPFDATTGAFRWSGTSIPDDTVVYDPYANFDLSTRYTARLDADVARDRSALLLDGDGDGIARGSPGDDHVWNFTTEATDATPPWIVATVPTEDRPGVVVTTSITIRFSEAMDVDRVGSAFHYTDGTGIWTAADGSSSWSLGSDVLTFRPLNVLSYGTKYTVTLEASATDLAGNPLDGDGDGTGGDPYTWNFTTAAAADTTPPTIASTSPADGARNVARRPSILIVFSEPMDAASVEGDISISGGAKPVGFSWPNAATVSFTTSSNLQYRMQYTLIVFTGARDLAGNRLTQPYQFSFTTEPWRGEVIGVVADVDGHGIANATVALNGMQVLSDESGVFRFGNVEQGAYDLAVTRTGYLSYTSSVTIDAYNHDLGRITLRQPADTTGVLIAGGVLVVVLGVLLGFVLWWRTRRREPPESADEWP